MFTKNEQGCTMYCMCGCTDGVVLKYDYDEWGAELSLVSDTYYLMQESTWERLKKKCKRIWNIICNKEYDYFNILIHDDDLKEFKEFVSNMERKK